MERKQIEALLAGFGAVGDAYLTRHPRTTLNKYFLNAHHNQFVAEQLTHLAKEFMSLGDNRFATDFTLENNLLKEINEIYTSFGTRLVSGPGELIYDMNQLLCAHYPDIQQKTLAIGARMAKARQQDDGGGCNDRWSINDYKGLLESIIKPTVEIEMKELPHNGG